MGSQWRGCSGRGDRFEKVVRHRPSRASEREGASRVG
jgi:hypothetical protein